MKTNVRDTSIDAYQKNLFSVLLPLSARAIEYLEQNGSASAKMIADALGIDTATCSGVLKPMKGKSIEVLPEKRKCLISGNTVYWLKRKST